MVCDVLAQMWDGDEHMGGGWWWVMGIGWLLFLAFVGFLTFLLVRHVIDSSRDGQRRSSAEDPGGRWPVARSTRTSTDVAATSTRIAATHRMLVGHLGCQELTGSEKGRWRRGEPARAIQRAEPILVSAVLHRCDRMIPSDSHATDGIDGVSPRIEAAIQLEQFHGLGYVSQFEPSEIDDIDPLSVGSLSDRSVARI